jgi:hypothetical protein
MADAEDIAQDLFLRLASAERHAYGSYSIARRSTGLSTCCAGEECSDRAAGSGRPSRSVGEARRSRGPADGGMLGSRSASWLQRRQRCLPCAVRGTGQRIAALMETSQTVVASRFTTRDPGLRKDFRNGREDQ